MSSEKSPYRELGLDGHIAYMTTGKKTPKTPLGLYGAEGRGKGKGHDWELSRPTGQKLAVWNQPGRVLICKFCKRAWFASQNTKCRGKK